MFKWNQPKEPTSLDLAIEKLLEESMVIPGDSEDYTTIVANIETLNRVKNSDSKDAISAETKATIAAHLLGILIVVGHERAHLITTKAFGFLTKLR